MVEVQAVVSNGSESDLSDVSFTLNSDMVNAAVGQLSSLPGVSIGPHIMNRPVARLQDQQGRQWDVPIQRRGGIWLVRCDKIPPHTGLTMVMALTNPDRPGDYVSRPDQGKRKPLWVEVQGTYKAVMRTRNINEKIAKF